MNLKTIYSSSFPKSNFSRILTHQAFLPPRPSSLPATWPTPKVSPDLLTLLPTSLFHSSSCLASPTLPFLPPLTTLPCTQLLPLVFQVVRGVGSKEFSCSQDQLQARAEYTGIVMANARHEDVCSNTQNAYWLFLFPNLTAHTSWYFSKAHQMDK